MPALRSLRHAAIFLIVFCLTTPAVADYTTPGTSVDWTMDDLVANSAGAVTGAGGAYEVHASVFVAPSDRLEIAAGSTLTFVDTTGEIGLEINGILSAIGTVEERILFTGSVATPGSWRGLDYRDAVTGSDFRLEFCEISYADEGVDIFGADATVWYSEIHHCLRKALDISSGNGSFHTISFHDNQQRTVTINLSSSPYIANCLYENNNVENSSPYPYINIGLQGTNSPDIHNNTIIGSGNHMSGGISIWALSEAQITSNRIEGCGYGILCYSTGANPFIFDNEIIDNNIHPDQLNWGFGIACNGDNAPVVGHNLIRGHWYGVAVINGGQPDLGDLVNGDPFTTGGNRIYDNGLGGQVYGLYNNTPLPQMAQGNWWGSPNEPDVEDAIYHQPDDPTLGLVDYSGWLTVSAVDGDTPAPRLSGVTAYPTPFNPKVRVSFSLATGGKVTVTVVDVAGRLVRKLHDGALAAGEQIFEWDGRDGRDRPQSSGVYFYRIETGAETQVGKMMLAR